MDKQNLFVIFLAVIYLFFKKTKQGANPLKPVFYKFCFSPGTEGISDGERRHW